MSMGIWASVYMCVDVSIWDVKKKQGRRKQFIHPPSAWLASRSTVGLNKGTSPPGINNVLENGTEETMTKHFLFSRKYWEPKVKRVRGIHWSKFNRESWLQLEAWNLLVLLKLAQSATIRLCRIYALCSNLATNNESRDFSGGSILIAHVKLSSDSNRNVS